MGRERGVQRTMPRASAPRSQGLGAARTRGRGGNGRRQRAWGAASRLGRPGGTKQPLFHLCPALGLLSTTPACAQQFPAPDCIREATAEGNARGPGRRLAGGRGGRVHVLAAAGGSRLFLPGPGWFWALTPGSSAWPAARCIPPLRCSQGLGFGCRHIPRVSSSAE